MEEFGELSLEKILYENDFDYKTGYYLMLACELNIPVLIISSIYKDYLKKQSKEKYGISDPPIFSVYDYEDRERICKLATKKKFIIDEHVNFGCLDTRIFKKLKVHTPEESQNFVLRYLKKKKQEPGIYFKIVYASDKITKPRILPPLSEA